MDGFEGFQDAAVGATTHWFDQGTVTVIVVDDENVIVAATGCNDELAGLVRVDLAGVGSFDDGGETLMRADVVGFAQRKSVGFDSGGFEFLCGGGRTVSRTRGDKSFLVDCLFLRTWSMWPLAIATDVGGCLRSVLRVKPMNCGRNPRFKL